MSVRRVHVTVSGAVQGVGFRWFARERAQIHGVGGWVRNRPDGDVELVAEGPDEAVNAFLAEMTRGPSRAHVTDIQIQDETSAAALPSPFEIRR